MDFDEMASAVAQAKQTIRVADSRVSTMAEICAGRLRHSNVSYTTLCRLKEELRYFNIQTGKWRNPK